MNLVKTCTKCNIEKSITEFHRRGDRHQNICKLCRLEAAKSPSTPRVSKDNRANFSPIADRIKALEPRLRTIANQFANDAHQAQDIFQHICEKLLLQADPADSNARILTTAKRRAVDFMSMERTYSFWVGTEDEMGGNASDEDDIDTFEVYASDSLSPEEEISRREDLAAIQQAIATLSPENQKVIAMLDQGCSHVEIARRLRVTPERASSLVADIAKVFATMGLQTA